MIYVLYAIFFISCVILIAAVLLQPGKTDAGALFTSNVSSTAFAPRGTASVLAKLTIGAAIVFMLSALLISMPALTGSISVLQSVNETPAEAPADAPAEVPAATNSNADANSTATVNADNTNSALVETPATNSIQRQAANAASNANSAPPANR